MVNYILSHSNPLRMVSYVLFILHSETKLTADMSIPYSTSNLISGWQCYVKSFCSNCSLTLIFLGYRHVSLRTNTNQSLDVSSLFICSRIQDEAPPELFSCSFEKDEKNEGGRRPMKNLLATIKNMGEVSKCDNEVRLATKL